MKRREYMRLLSRMNPRYYAGLAAVIVAGFIGCLFLFHSFATTPAGSVEAESGSATGGGISTVNDSTASNSQAERFAAASSQTAPCGRTTTAPTYKHVVWIWEENKDSSSVNGSAPYFDTISGQCASLTAVQDSATTISLPSEPQYAAATSGSNCNSGITSNSGSGTGCITNDADGSQLSTESIFQLVKTSGGSWKSYQEGMQSNCAQGSGGTKYAFKHNPAAFYSQIRSDCDTLDIPISSVTCPTTSDQTCGTPANQLVTDINASALPTYSFITPNLNNDMHDGSVIQGDNWLHTYLPLLINGPNYKSGNTVIFVMWDEGSANSGTSRQIPTTVIAPSIAAGKVVPTSLNNIGVLRTTEEVLNLTPYLGCASGTPPGGTGTCNGGSNVSIKAALNL